MEVLTLSSKSYQKAQPDSGVYIAGNAEQSVVTHTMHNVGGINFGTFAFKSGHSLLHSTSFSNI
jgi:hypothetical protein